MGYPCERRQWRGRVCRGHREHVVGFAYGSLLTMKFFAVPRSSAALLERCQDGHGRVIDAKHVIWAIGEAMQLLDAWGSVWDAINVRRHGCRRAVVFVVRAGPD